MPAVEVRVFATLREITGASSLTVEASSVGEALSSLSATYGERFRRLLFAEGGELQEAVTVLANGRNIRFLAGLDTPLQAGDTVALIPPVAGGQAPCAREKVRSIAARDRGKWPGRLRRR